MRTLCLCLLLYAQPEPKAVEPLTRLRNLVAEVEIDTRDLPAELPLAKLLTALETKVPGHKLSLRLDLPDLADVKVPVRRQEKTTLAAVLRDALRQIADTEYALRPPDVVVTRPRKATHTVECDLRDLSPDGPEEVVRWLLQTVELRDWESLELRNGHRLLATATPGRHEEIDDALTALRRLHDVRVVMNARLIEVDRDFYTKHLAALFTPEQNVVALQGPLFQRLAQQKVVGAGDNSLLRPGVASPFLAKQPVFRYPGGSGLAGVTFAARPVVSADRRFLQVRLAQQVTQFAGVHKVTELDLPSGKDVTLSVPNVRRSSVTGTVALPDGGAILMPSPYRPAGEDKVWLLVARPYIWIEDEVAEIRAGGGDVTPEGVWESGVGWDPKAGSMFPKP